MRRRRFCARQMLLHCIYYVTCYFRSKHTKIVGGYHEKNSDDKTVTVFPEIFIDCCKMFHSLSLFFYEPGCCTSLKRLLRRTLVLQQFYSSTQQPSQNIFDYFRKKIFSKLPH